ncbi:hypothetical protein Tco_0244442, partial [Tanacetum coccineum]
IESEEPCYGGGGIGGRDVVVVIVMTVDVDVGSGVRLPVTSPQGTDLVKLSSLLRFCREDKVPMELAASSGFDLAWPSSSLPGFGLAW